MPEAIVYTVPPTDHPYEVKQLSVLLVSALKLVNNRLVYFCCNQLGCVEQYSEQVLHVASITCTTATPGCLSQQGKLKHSLPVCSALTPLHERSCSEAQQMLGETSLSHQLFQSISKIKQRHSTIVSIIITLLRVTFNIVSLLDSAHLLVFCNHFSFSNYC